MAHPLVLALFATPAAAATAARALHARGIERDQISVVSRSHDEEGALADQMDASPGADIEDSRPAARLGELGGLVLAAGPLAAGLGEAAGHVAGGVAATLKASGVPGPRAEQIEEAVERGRVLLAVHATADQAGIVKEALVSAEPLELDVANWNEDR